MNPQIFLFDSADFNAWHQYAYQRLMRGEVTPAAILRELSLPVPGEFYPNGMSLIYPTGSVAHPEIHSVFATPLNVQQEFVPNDSTNAFQGSFTPAETPAAFTRTPSK